MGPAIKFEIPLSSETMYHAEVEIKKQAGRYSLTVHPYGDIEQPIVEKVRTALEDVVSKLNGK